MNAAEFYQELLEREPDREGLSIEARQSWWWGISTAMELVVDAHPIDTETANDLDILCHDRGNAIPRLDREKIPTEGIIR